VPYLKGISTVFDKYVEVILILFVKIVFYLEKLIKINYIIRNESVLGLRISWYFKQ